MSDGSLTQQEIDALLEGDDAVEEQEDSAKEESGQDETESKESSAPAPAKKVSKSDKARPGMSELSSLGNIDLLMDVNMNLSVELGRTKMEVKNVLELGNGSIIELDKFSGEPVDIMVNNRLIARGEVVAIDESFGVKVTEIIDPEERLKVGL